MSCDVGKATKGLKGWRISCDVVEVTERLENELYSVKQNNSVPIFSDNYIFYAPYISVFMSHP